MADLNWRRSSRCGSGTCVEVARLPHSGAVVVRDSKEPNGPVLVFTADEWAGFLDGARRGEFDG